VMSPTQSWRAAMIEHPVLPSPLVDSDTADATVGAGSRDVAAGDEPIGQMSAVAIEAEDNHVLEHDPALDFVDAARVPEPSACDSNGHVKSALPGLHPGAFRSIADMTGENRTRTIAKVTRPWFSGKGSGFALLSLGAWILSNIDDAQAQPALLP